MNTQLESHLHGRYLLPPHLRCWSWHAAQDGVPQQVLVGQVVTWAVHLPVIRLSGVPVLVGFAGWLSWLGWVAVREIQRLHPVPAHACHTLNRTLIVHTVAAHNQMLHHPLTTLNVSIWKHVKAKGSVYALIFPVGRSVSSDESLR